VETIGDLQQIFNSYNNYHIKSIAPDIFVNQYQLYSDEIQKQVGHTINTKVGILLLAMIWLTTTYTQLHLNSG